MGDVIFCATQFYLDGGYRSYTDFFKLVELSGYPVIPLSQLDPQSDHTYIITPLNGEWLHGWQQPKARIIHWELEWRTDWRAEVNEPPGVAEVWASDKWYAGKIGAKYVPVGSHYDLNVRETVALPPKIYDVSLLSYQTNRRMGITQELQNKGLKLAPVQNLWGFDRSLSLLQSRVMVHVHQHDNTPGIAPLRWCLAAAHGLPIISENVNDRGIFGYSAMMTSNYQELPAFTRYMLQDRRLMQDYAWALQGLLCEQYTFQKVVEANV